MGGQVGGLIFTSNFLQFCSKLFTDAFPRVRKNELKQIALKALLFQLITDVDDLWRIFLFFFFLYLHSEERINIDTYIYSSLQKV